MKSITTTDTDDKSLTTPGESFSKNDLTGEISKEFQSILLELQQASSTVAKLASQYGYTSTGPFTTHKTNNGHLYYTSNDQLPKTTKESLEEAIEIVNPKHKQCWHNAKMIASIVDEAEYTEGYAFKTIPVQHGWVTINTDPVTLVEVTNPFYEYIGLRMPNIQDTLPNALFNEWLGENKSIIRKHQVKSNKNTQNKFVNDVIPLNNSN